VSHSSRTTTKPRRGTDSLRDAGLVLLLVLAALTVRVDLPQAVRAFPETWAGEVEPAAAPAVSAADQASFAWESEVVPAQLPAAPAERVLERLSGFGVRLQTAERTFGVEFDEKLFLFVVDVEQEQERKICRADGSGLAC
jgi:hypothetical protein